MEFTPEIWILKHLRDRLRTARAHFDGVRGTLEESWSGLGTSIGCVQDKTDLSTNHEYDVLIYLEAYDRIIHIFFDTGVQVSLATTIFFSSTFAGQRIRCTFDAMKSLDLKSSP